MLFCVCTKYNVIYSYQKHLFTVTVVVVGDGGDDADFVVFISIRGLFFKLLHEMRIACLYERTEGVRSFLVIRREKREELLFLDAIR
jgi:hypothetical protein